MAWTLDDSRPIWPQLSQQLARQIIAAMNMNKSFYLPQNFSMIKTANSPGQALALPGIQERLALFGQNILDTLCQ